MSNWTSILVFAAILLLFLLFKRAGQIPAKAAAEHLKNGAMVIDVRSPGEFGAGHLPQAVNIPLDQIEAIVPRKVKDKNQVLLLHCQSGMRSSVAKKRLSSLGYTSVYNLGSYARAAQVVGNR